VRGDVAKYGQKLPKKPSKKSMAANTVSAKRDLGRLRGTPGQGDKGNR
jgi:hypothetical protein